MAYIFKQLQTSPGLLWVHYIEIYNEVAYDLLDPQRLTTPIDQWKKVALFFFPDQKGQLPGGRARRDPLQKPHLAPVLQSEAGE